MLNKLVIGRETAKNSCFLSQNVREYGFEPQFSDI